MNEGSVLIFLYDALHSLIFSNTKWRFQCFIKSACWIVNDEYLIQRIAVHVAEHLNLSPISCTNDNK